MPQIKRILCVDDHDDTCLMLKVFLGQAGYEVKTANTMADGLKLAQAERFDLYICDLWFEDGEGHELCEQIRAFDPSTPIVIHSGDVYEASKQRALDAGAQAFIPKPTNLEVFIETINRLAAFADESTDASG